MKVPSKQSVDGIKRREMIKKMTNLNIKPVEA
jgi:hypothetical protein